MSELLVIFLIERSQTYLSVGVSYLTKFFLLEKLMWDLTKTDKNIGVVNYVLNWKI